MRPPLIRNWAQSPTKAHVFASHDGGDTWTKIATVNGQYWSSIFTQGSSVYLLGTASDGSAANANETGISLSRSTDGGLTWQRKVA